LGGTRFYDRKEIRDAVGYLKLINNPDDDIALRRVINVPRRGIGDTTVERVAAYAINNSISMYEAMKNCNAIEGLTRGVGAKLEAFVQIIEQLRYDEANGVNPIDIFKKTMELTSYEQSLRDDKKEDAQNRLDNIKELVNKISEYTRNNPENPSISGLLEEISLVSDVDSYDADSDTVVLMTLHSSKGLEFDTVFIIGFENNIFPSRMAIDDSNRDGIEEERRLCYVGITRAKKTLYLTCARSRMQNGSMTTNFPSKFLSEIPKENIETLSPIQPTMNVGIGFGASKFAPKLEMTGSQSNRGDNKSLFSSFSAPKEVVVDYKTGDKVKHIKFGTGTVLDMTSAGADYEVKVEFETVGIKRLMAKLSRLKKI
jgi:DNA helicase-2/ATP-dependent DNA helicase PcrA